MIVIIDYGLGNLGSIQKAFNRIGVTTIISNSISEIESAKKLILPGVGHFTKGMQNLKESGFIDVLNRKVIIEKTPILGICLGMQMMTDFSEEGNVEGLGWIKAKTIHFSNINKDSNIKIPHIGWNSLEFDTKNPLFNKIDLNAQFYFVHSYYVQCENHQNSMSRTNYILKYDSSIQNENIYGVQFHPEKSHSTGLQLLKNFAEL
jgi:glutamine amidotransferase